MTLPADVRESMVATRRAGVAAQIALGSIGVLALALEGALEMQAGLLQRAIAGIPPTIDEASVNDARINGLQTLWLPLYLMCAVAFLVWFHRALTTARHLKAGFSYEPKQGVTAFFVPFANLWVPHTVMTELVHASDPTELPPAPAEVLPTGGAPYRATGTDEAAYAVPAVPTSWWWGFYVVANLASLGTTIHGDRDLPSLVNLTRHLQFSRGFVILAAVFAILVIRAVVARLDERARRQDALPTDPPFTG